MRCYDLLKRIVITLETSLEAVQKDFRAEMKEFYVHVDRKFEAVTERMKPDANKIFSMFSIGLTMIGMAAILIMLVISGAVDPLKIQVMHNQENANRINEVFYRELENLQKANEKILTRIETDQQTAREQRSSLKSAVEEHDIYIKQLQDELDNDKKGRK